MGKGQGNCWRKYNNNREQFLTCMLDNEMKFDKFKKRFEMGQLYFSRMEAKCLHDANEHGKDLFSKEKNFDKCFKKYSKKFQKCIRDFKV